MTDSTPSRSYKPIYWALVVVAFLALCAWAYVGTRHSDRAVERASANASGVGADTAYDPTTGKTVGAGAVPGALGTGGPSPTAVAPEVVTPPPPAAPSNGSSPGQ